MSFFVKIIAKIAGIALLVMGIAGFFMNGYVGPIAVGTINNVLHIIVGLIGLSSSSTYGYARSYLIVFGLFFAVIGVMAILGGGNIAGILSTNQSGGITYLVTGAVMMVFGFGSKKKI